MSKWALLLLTLCAAAQAAEPSVAPDTIEARAQGCMTCHGPTGAGTADGNFPRIAGKPAGYLFNQLENFRDGHRSYPPMNYLVAYMSDEYLRQFAEFFSAQSMDAEATFAPTPAADPGAERLVTGGDPARNIPACTSCHGTRLTGLEPGVPGLLGLDSRYIAAQLVSWRVGTRHAKEPDCMSGIASRLSENEVRRVAAWLGSRRPADPSTSGAAGAWRTPLPCGSALEPSAATLPRSIAAANVMTRGEYLAHVGDCVACHSNHDDVPFAGGFPLPTPFGTLYSPNITPDKVTGIGKWSADDFYRMLHTGHSRDGTLLYPAMPFPAYTKVTREDSDALFAYLMSLKPEHRRNRENALRFPYDNRALLYGWRALYFREGTFAAQPDKSAEFNRGAYLVEGLGHCASCHSPINALGGSGADSAFAGGLIPMQNWYAPSLTSSSESGLGGWSTTDIASLLKNGTSLRGAVYGPMAEVTHDSLQYLTSGDATAIGVYLKSLLHSTEAKQQPTDTPATSAITFALGRSVYSDRCAACHRSDGKGMPPSYPPLAGNPSIEMDVAVNPLRMVLNGGYAPETSDNPRPYGMPPFAQVLSDEEVAAVVTFVRQSWGNHGSSVAARDANAMRLAPLLD